jgi:hypothetical protein
VDKNRNENWEIMITRAFLEEQKVESTLEKGGRRRCFGIARMILVAIVGIYVTPRAFFTENITDPQTSLISWPL